MKDIEEMERLRLLERRDVRDAKTSIGDKIAYLLNKSYGGFKEYAEAKGLSYQTPYQWVKGMNIPSLTMASQMLTDCKCSPNEVMWFMGLEALR